MANGTPSGTKIEYDSAAGSLLDISQYVLTISELSVEQVLEEVHSFGDSWEEHLPVAIGKMSQITIGGLYDNTATSGPNAIFANRIPETSSTQARTFKVTYISTANNTAVETFLSAYKRQADRNSLTKWAATLQPTGAVTESTS